MQYFTIDELTRSDIAKSRKIDNTPTPQAKANLVALVGKVLDPLRSAYGQPIIVTSGYRSPALNRAVDGAATSQHVKGEAADIICSDNRRLFEIAKQMMREGKIRVGQLIDEKNYSWIHISLPYSKVNQVLHWDGKRYVEEKL